MAFEGPHFGLDELGDETLVVRSAEASDVWLPGVDHERLDGLLKQARLTEYALRQSGIESPTQEQYQLAQEQAMQMIAQN